MNALHFSQKASEESSLGSTGDPPVLSGDPPDRTGVTARTNEDGLLVASLSAVPVGGSPTGARESPALPNFQNTRKLVAAIASKDVSGEVKSFLPKPEEYK